MASLLRGFATINQVSDGQSSSDQPGLTTEAKEQRAIAAFERALALIQSRHDTEAEAALRTLLEEPVVAEGATDQLHRIKFLALKNLGDLTARQLGGTEHALAFYSTATQIVEDDAVLWNKLGSLAAESGFVAAARTAFERGLEVDPHHPTMPDKLLSLLIQAGDAPATAALATALLRQNPRHAGAAAALAAQQRGNNGAVAAVTCGGLLQLPPVDMRPGREARPSQRQHLERPRTLEQPTWQQLLHHSLLFLTGNRLAEGAAPTAAGGGLLSERKAVPSLVRFSYKKNPPPGQQAQTQQQAGQQPGDAPEMSPAAPATQKSPKPAGAPPSEEQGRQEQHLHQQGTATPAPSVSPSPAPASAQGEGASPAALKVVDHSPAAPGGLEAATPGAPAASTAGTDVASSPNTAHVQCSPSASPAAFLADEGQEQRHPSSRSSRKVEGRSTRSRAATGAAPLPLVPAAGAGDQEQIPDEEALDLLGTLGSRLSKLHQAALGAKTSSPLLSSPTKARPNAAAGSSDDQESAGSEHEEEAVKAFIKQLPAQGVSRPDLATLLLSMLGSSSGATQLSTAARLQLLQVAHFVEHDDMALSPEQCLVLGELFADAAVAAARVSPHPGSVQLAAAGTSTSAAAQAGRGSTPTAPNMRQSSGLVKRSARARGRLTELALEQLQQSCQLWLSRYRLAVAEAVVSPSEGLMMGQARYWWATGRLLESSGEMSAASTAYSCCKDSLTELVGHTIPLPHCQADASISQVTVKSKQEALQLHTVLAVAGQCAAAGNHVAVVDALAPVLLCCTDKEQQMLQLDEQQWHRGMQMLLSAATASCSLGLVLRCHLRLLNALLPAVPRQLQPLAQGREDVVCAEAASLLHAAAEQLMARREAAAALDAAASFLQQHSAALLLLPAAVSGSANLQQKQHVALHLMELAMFEEVQLQAVLAVAGCAASLAAAGPGAAESALSLKVNAKRGAMVDAATILLLLDSLAADTHMEHAMAGGGGAGSVVMLQAVERAQDVAWHLCEALGAAQAMMDRRGRFVQVCMGELQSLLKRLDVLGAIPPAQTDDAPDAVKLRQQLTGGVQHCLYWLFGLELPGFDKQEEWGGDFHAKGSSEAAARQLTCAQAVADVWPLVEPFLLQDVEHITKHKGFLQAAAQHFSELPALVAARSRAAWCRLSAAEPPHMLSSLLEGTYPDIMQRLLELASQTSLIEPSEAQEAAAASALASAPMAVDVPGCSPPRREGEDEARHAAVLRTLYYLLSELQDKERISVEDLLGNDAEAALERHVQAAKADLCFNPQRSATWEKLAHEYHGAADDLLDAASKTVTHRQWRHNRDLRHRVQLWRRLAYWSTAGAWLSAADGDDRTRLLAASGWRLLQDVLRTLPCQDPLASNTAWQEVKSSSAYQEGCRQAEAAFNAAAAALEQQNDNAGWELLVAKARCLRKQQQQPAIWLPLLARACHYASSNDGGMLYPLYTLHASRMRLLLAMPSADRWACGGVRSARQAQRSGRRRDWQQQGGEQERELLQLVGSYCFLPASNTSLNSPSQRARMPAAAVAEEELREDWQGLLEDCCAAMRWCLEKDRNFHRAAYRLADAMQRTGQPHKAVALLEPLFTRGKQIFTVNIMPILESRVDAVARRGRKARQLDGGGQQELEQGREGADSEAEPECKWGEPPTRLAGIGMQEDEATFGTRLRKTLRLYFSCLADAAMAGVNGQVPPDSEVGRQPPLDVLQQAAAYISSMSRSASKALDGCDMLARGHLLLALVACLEACCPLEQLPSLGPPAPAPAAGVDSGDTSGMEANASQAQHAQQYPAGQQTPGAALAATHATRVAGPLSAAPASEARATPAEFGVTARSLWPTPATQARQQVSEKLLRVASNLDGTEVEQLLSKAHQVFSDYSVHAEGDDKWQSTAGPAVLEAFSNSSSSLAVDEGLRQRCSQPNLRKLFNLYAMLHVHLLQHQGASEKLLTLLLAMKKQVKGMGSAEPRQVRFLRRQALMLSDALLGAVEGALAQAEHDVAAGGALSPSHPAARNPAAAMEVEGQLAGGPAHQEPQAHLQGMQGQSPAAASGSDEGQSSPGPTGHANGQQECANQTPAGATAAAAAEGTAPGSDPRAALGSPAQLLSAEQQELQERCMTLLQITHSFHRELSRWLQMVGAAATGSSAAAREEMQALGSIGEAVLLRAYRLHARCMGQPTMAELSRQSRTEQLKAADEAAKQQRRQSRQQGAAGRQQQQQGGAPAAVAGALAPIAEAGEEQAAPAGRKRGPASANEAAPPTARKRVRSASVALQLQQAQQDEQEEEAAAVAVHQVVAQALEAAVAAEEAAQ